MQTPLDKPSQKVKNILVRHTCSKKVHPNSNYQHPETSYILKYAPKYYKSLTLQATCQSPLLSKVKKIKKLKAFTGYFNRHLPQQLWFDLLGNNRKEIKEAPQIFSSKKNIRPGLSFWKRLNQQKLKHFWNLTRIWLPKQTFDYFNRDNFLSSKESFVKHVWNLRKLKSLEILVQSSKDDNLKWVLGKLDGMDRLFKRLETLCLDLGIESDNLQVLFQNKRLFSHVTGLNLVLGFEPTFAEIPFICKKLNSLSLSCQRGIDEKPEFRSFLTSVRQLTQLKSLVFSGPGDGKNFWGHFKPQPSLEHLSFSMIPESFINAGLFDGDKLKDVVAHWEDIKELKTLGFGLSCSNFEEFRVMRMFMTSVMKKVQKLKALNFWVGTPLRASDCQKMCEPFFVEDVPHLYESLENFGYQLDSWTDNRFVPFVMETLKPFRNLKSLSLGGDMITYGNIEEIVSLLEGNQGEGEYPVLGLNLKMPIDFSAEGLGNILKLVQGIKNTDKNLEIILDFKFVLKEGYLEILEGLCMGVESVRRIKGVKIYLSFKDNYDESQFPIEQVRELLGRYPGVWNLNIVLSNYNENLKFIKIDGEKEQFFSYSDY